MCFFCKDFHFDSTPESFPFIGRYFLNNQLVLRTRNRRRKEKEAGQLVNVLGNSLSTWSDTNQNAGHLLLRAILSPQERNVCIIYNPPRKCKNAIPLYHILKERKSQDMAVPDNNKTRIAA